jgi:hypothetical protein
LTDVLLLSGDQVVFQGRPKIPNYSSLIVFISIIRINIHFPTDVRSLAALKMKKPPELGYLLKKRWRQLRLRYFSKKRTINWILEYYEMMLLIWGQCSEACLGA